MLKTLDLALNILLCFTKEKTSWGARELAKELGISHANVYRILSTFEANRFLVKDPETKKYSLGIRFWELGLLSYDAMNVGKLLRPVLQRLMEATSESVMVTSLDTNQGLTLEVLEPDNVVRYTVTVGSRAPLYVGASYRSILAFMPEEKVEQIIAQGLVQYTPKTMTDPEVLRADLATIRETGIARSEGEYTPDIIALAVPIFHYNGKIMGSLTISGPTYRMTDEKVEHCIDMLKKAKVEIDEIVTKYQLDLSHYFISE